MTDRSIDTGATPAELAQADAAMESGAVKAQSSMDRRGFIMAAVGAGLLVTQALNPQIAKADEADDLLAGMLDEVETEIVTADERIATADEQIATADERIAAADAEIAILEERIATAEANIQKAIAERPFLLQKVERLMEEVREAKIALAQSERILVGSEIKLAKSEEYLKNSEVLLAKLGEIKDILGIV